MNKQGSTEIGSPVGLDSALAVSHADQTKLLLRTGLVVEAKEAHKQLV